MINFNSFHSRLIVDELTIDTQDKVSNPCFLAGVMLLVSKIGKEFSTTTSVVDENCDDPSRINQPSSVPYFSGLLKCSLLGHLGCWVACLGGSCSA